MIMGRHVHGGRAGLAILLSIGIASQAAAQHSAPPDAGAELHIIYEWLHQNPELSFREQRTATLLAGELKHLGFDVSEHVGDTWVRQEVESIIGHPVHDAAGYGVVGILRNGHGPTIMIRTDMDALPVEEETGFPYASTTLSTTITGTDSAVMHACGHDIHMATWIGAARTLTERAHEWSGTLVMVAQPAEELGLGALSMIEDGAFESHLTTNYNLAFHVSDSLPTGKIGYASGPAMASIDAVDITVNGVGGHGAYPHMTKDPVVIAAYIVTAMQTLVSRTVDPLEPAVVTVGSIVSGTKHNIISDEATLLLTVRTYDDATRQLLLDGIVRIAEGQAIAFGAPPPDIQISSVNTPSVVNDPGLASRAIAVLNTTLGDDVVEVVRPVMSGEDFGRYGRLGEGVPSLLLWLGAVSPETFAAANGEPTALPSLHSPKFAPDASAIAIGVTAMTAIAMDLFGEEPPSP